MKGSGFFFRGAINSCYFFARHCLSGGNFEGWWNIVFFLWDEKIKLSKILKNKCSKNIICKIKLHAYKIFCREKKFSWYAYNRHKQENMFMPQFQKILKYFHQKMCLLSAHHEKNFAGKKYLCVWSFVSQIILSVYQKAHVTKNSQIWQTLYFLVLVIHQTSKFLLMLMLKLIIGLFYGFSGIFS